MKRMSKEAQMNNNGGVYTHCDHCGKSFFGLTKSSAIKKILNHRAETGHYWWHFGHFGDCPIAK